MGWNCFKTEKEKAEGKAPLKERISETLQNRFPRLYRLIKRIKENGAPSKIKLRRRRKLNSVVPVSFQNGTATNKNESFTKTSERRRTISGLKSETVPEKSNVERMRVLPSAVGGTTQNGSMDLSKDSLGSSKDSIQIRSLVDSVVNSTLQETSNDSSQSAYEAATMRDGRLTSPDTCLVDGRKEIVTKTSQDDQERRRTVTRIGSSSDYTGTSCDSMQINSLVDDVIAKTMKENSNSSDSVLSDNDVSSKCCNDVENNVIPAKSGNNETDWNGPDPDRHQVAEFVSGIIASALDKVRQTLTCSPNIEGFNLEPASKPRGHEFNETAWEVVGVDDEDNVIDVTANSDVVSEIRAVATVSATGGHDENVNKACESKVGDDDEKADKMDGIGDYLIRPVEAHSAPNVVSKTSHPKRLKTMSASVNTPLEGDSQAAENQIYPETGDVGQGRALSTDKLRNAWAKSEAYVDRRGQIQSAVDSDLLASGNIDISKQGEGRKDSIPAAGNEIDSGKWFRDGVPDCDVGHCRELEDLTTSVVEEVVNKSLVQAKVSTEGVDNIVKMVNGTQYNPEDLEEEALNATY